MRSSVISLESLRAQLTTSNDDNISCTVVQYGSYQAQEGALFSQTLSPNSSILYNDAVTIVSFSHQAFLLDVILGSVAVCVTIVALLICITTIPLKIHTDNEDCQSEESSKDAEWSEGLHSDIVSSHGYHDECEVINDMLSSLSVITNEDNAGIESVFYCVEGCFVLHNMDKCSHQQLNSSSVRPNDSRTHC